MKATLISWTNDPIGTALTVWEASKTERPLADIQEQYCEQREGAHRWLPAGDMALFERILDQQIPVAQFVTFDFVLENVPVSWREQAVRHRIGVKYGENYAVDIVPEADISFWSQSMRIQTMASFAEDGAYHIPDSIGANDWSAKIYGTAMRQIERAYAELVNKGIPMEDARNLIPLGATHRIAMSVNLQALKHIIGERGCWILQGSLWAPVIKSMVAELEAKVHPIFRKLVAPPCVENGAFKSCVFKEENNRRVDGRDSLPVCPLFIHYHSGGWDNWRNGEKEEVDVRIPEYNDLWGQNLTAQDWSWKPS